MTVGHPGRAGAASTAKVGRVSDSVSGFDLSGLHRLPSRAEIQSTADSASIASGADWGGRFSRSAERERRLGITAEWLAQHKEGVEEQRAG
jgi:hypothetical protein